MRVARRTGVDPGFVTPHSARRASSRADPKPGRALREIGLEPQVTTEKPTSEGIAEMLSRLDLVRPSRRPAALPRQGSQHD